MGDSDTRSMLLCPVYSYSHSGCCHCRKPCFTKTGCWKWKQPFQCFCGNLRIFCLAFIFLFLFFCLRQSFFFPFRLLKICTYTRKLILLIKIPRPRSQGLHRIPQWACGTSRSIPQVHFLVSLWGYDPFFLEILASHRRPPWWVNTALLHWVLWRKAEHALVKLAILLSRDVYSHKM